MNELTKLKYWLDAEFSLLHIGIYVIIGLLVDSTLGWVICGLLIFVSILYMVKRTTALPKDYLKVKKGQ